MLSENSACLRRFVELRWALLCHTKSTSHTQRRRRRHEWEAKNRYGLLHEILNRHPSTAREFHNGQLWLPSST